MKLKHKIIVGYFVMAILYTLYASNFGATAYKGFAFNFGQGLVWPAVIFPTFGAIVGAVLVFILVAVITMS